MDVLSASSYPLPADSSRDPAAAAGPNAGRILFGGLIEASELHDSEIIEDRADETKRPRKRTRRQEKSDDDETTKKQRGRPRVISQDETAADRRRTQIRLAQRAYRLRKETTIDALKNRVAELEDHIGQMNRSFQHFSDNAMESGAVASYPKLAQQLEEIAEQFLKFAKIAMPDSDGDENGTGEITQTENLLHEDQIPATGGHSSRNPIREDDGSRMWDSSLGTDPLWKDTIPDEVVPSPHQHQQHGEHQSEDQNDITWSSEVPQSGITLSTLTRIQKWNQDLSETYTPPIERSLRSDTPYTYSFQESTFARRLHRATLEHGFRLLTIPTTNPQLISSAFQFTLCFVDRKHILGRFQEILKRGPKDSLENWQIPYLRVGGAGTHYPRVDDWGRKSYPPNTVSPSALFFGPMQHRVGETPREEKNIDDLLDAIGFGGKWFDSNDVENYLRHKGIYLDGQSSFVEVPASELSIPFLTPDETSQHTSITPSTFSRSPAVESSRRPSMRGDSPEVVTTMETRTAPEATNVPGNNVTDFSSWSQNIEQSFTDMWQQQQQINQITQGLVTLDVQKFLDNLIPKSACLGRAPGFRHSDVDSALAVAVQESY